MNWFTSFDIPRSKDVIDYESKILTIGSCFSDVMGAKLRDRKFQVLINPFGTLFNPVSIFENLTRSLRSEQASPTQITSRDGLFYHYAYHSDLVGRSEQELLTKISERQEQTRAFLVSCAELIITLGTSWIYELKDTPGVLSNCHKQPQSWFEKRVLKLEEMQQAFQKLHAALAKVNPKIRITLTVSPVRHIKDGIPENQLSKSLLRVFCEEICRTSERTTYFPSYEIMMDELREYRFYKQDKIHPSEEAETYIWDRWMQTYLSDEAQKQVAEIEKLLRELSHRSPNPASTAHQEFLKNLIRKMERLAPRFDFSTEIAQLRASLID
ncbi:GSCFA domain-containing protein [Algoriphagus namhaensis]